MIQILCKNTKKTGNFKFGTSIFEIYNKIGPQLPYPPLCAYVNNRVEGLDYRVYKNKQVEFLDYTRYNGMKVYIRSLFMVLMKAVDDVYACRSYTRHCPRRRPSRSSANKNWRARRC